VSPASRALVVVLAGAAPALSCATIEPYDARLVARGELTLRYTDRFEMLAGNRPLTRGLTWDGLADYVACVPEARKHAEGAAAAGRTALVFTGLGVGLGVTGLGVFAGFGVEHGKYLGEFLLTGLAVATVGLVFAGLSRSFKNSANGQAVDAMNFYNDQVGSLGATCADLQYPAPAGPTPPGAEPPPPPAATPPPPAEVGPRSP
jgi:hypothetical protein